MSQLELVERIQAILVSLYETGRSIPPEFAIDFSLPNLQVSRTGASLYLMLFQVGHPPTFKKCLQHSSQRLQAIIHCVRPVVLQCVRQKLQRGQDDDVNAQYTPTVRRLCQTCDEAARKSLRILSVLQQDNIIGMPPLHHLSALAYSC